MMMIGIGRGISMFGPLKGMWLVLVIVLALCACERSKEEADMRRQPKLAPYGETTFWDDNKAARRPPEGTVPATESRLPAARLQDGPNTLSFNEPVLRRGKERFNIWCSNCHGLGGLGNGPVARRGFPNPPSLHSQWLRESSDAYIYRVMSKGLGKMPGYENHIDQDDRWAIVTYVRALQVSQYVPISEIPENMRERVKAGEQLSSMSEAFTDLSAPEEDVDHTR
jgi:mono/diheme cytochrome c family protein